MNYEDIKKECENIQDELETIIPSEINFVIDRARVVAAYHSRTGYLLAEAKKIVRAKKTNEISNAIVKIAKDGFLCATAQKALVDSIASEEQYLVDWLDRINSACVHQIDLMRSIISKEKEEMKFQNFGS